MQSGILYCIVHVLYIMNIMLNAHTYIDCNYMENLFQRNYFLLKIGMANGAIADFDPLLILRQCCRGVRKRL